MTILRYKTDEYGICFESIALVDSSAHPMMNSHAKLQSLVQSWRNESAWALRTVIKVFGASGHKSNQSAMRQA